ncbi:MAG: extracellular solute-binding protein [Parcubacteria group bacterium]|nr:extracellular solute-binding protein [Parcubacteria group bacterium]
MGKLIGAIAGIILIIGVFIAIVAAIFRPPPPPPPPPPVTLKYWRLWDDEEDLSDIIAAYKQIRPNVTIEYRKLDIASYEEELLEAFATDQGPDILSIRHDWIPKYISKGFIAPAPPALLPLETFRTAFVDVVIDDVVKNGKIYAVPYSIDTLALYYNPELFNFAKIPFPPTTWEEFKTDVEQLTVYDSRGKITRAGATLGTTDNVSRGYEMLMLLMMQNGTKMVSEDGRTATFNQPIPVACPGVSENSCPAGLLALQFYTDFANPQKEVYTWDPKLAFSTDAFAEGKVAMTFGYSFFKDAIRAKAPKLRWEIAPMPQVDPNREVNFAQYWVETVATKSKHQDEAWAFLAFASRSDKVQGYLNRTGNPPARRDMANVQGLSKFNQVFANQILTAQSFPKGEVGLTEQAFVDMIRAVNSGEASPATAIQQGAQTVTTALQRYSVSLENAVQHTLSGLFNIGAPAQNHAELDAERRRS